MHKLSDLAKDINIYDSIFSKFIGMMFSKNKDRALVFRFKRERYVPLHMFFVFYPIDVLYLNKNKEVIETKQNFRPFTCYRPANNAQYVVELPNNTIKTKNILLKDKIIF